MQVFDAKSSFISLRSCKLSLKEINQFYGELNECKRQFLPYRRCAWSKKTVQLNYDSR